VRIGVNTLSVIPDAVGGGETYLSRLLAALRERLGPRDGLVLFVTRENERLFPPAGDRVRVVRLPVPQRLRPLRLAAEHALLPALLAVRPVDVLLSPGNALPLLAGVRHVLALQSMHYRYVPDQMSRFRVRYFRRMVPLSAGRAARVLCMSRDLARSLGEVAPRAAGKTRVVYEGADLRAFSPEGEVAGGEPYLLYVSSLNRFKRPDRVVEAVARLVAEGFPVPLLRLVGRPDPEDRARIERLVAETGTADRVRIEGVVPHGLLPPLYRGARALVYPSAVETFGLPPLEAMACGCPVVASNRTSVPEIVGDGGLVVDPDDVPALARAIRRVLTEEDLRRDLVRRGLSNVRRFSWERAAEETLQELRAACRE
jgi:glycosyltransferase involved in cell wall biosynthesis